MTSLLLLSLGLSLLQESEPDKVVKALVQAYNAGSAEELHKLCNDGFKNALPVSRLAPLLQQAYAQFGPARGWQRGSPEGPWLVYRLRGEKKSFVLKLVLDEEGLVAGLQFNQPAAAAEVVEQTVADFVEAYNAGSAENVRQLFDAGLRKALPQDQLQQLLEKWRRSSGKITATESVRTQGEVHTYRLLGDKRTLALHVAVTADGQLSGLRLTEPLTLLLPAQAITLADLQQRLASTVERTLADENIPSISLALVKDDRILWAEAFGYMNQARKAKADRDTVYVGGSIAKVLVATAVMQLVDEGKLHLDAPISHYLKKFPIANPFEKEVPLTTRHLLCHRGGIPNGGEEVPLWRRSLPTSLEDYVRTKVRVTEKPGTRFRYSNLGYALLGYLLCELDGRPFEEILQRRLFRPLEMNRTAVEPSAAMEEHLAVPYLSSSPLTPPRVTYRVRLALYPAGELYSTPSDMARFLLLQVNGGTVNGKRLLSPESVRAMATRVPDKHHGNMGLGWILGRRNDRPLLWHNGAVRGFSSYMAIDPEQRQGVVLFANEFEAHREILPELAQFALALLDKLKQP